MLCFFCIWSKPTKDFYFPEFQKGTLIFIFPKYFLPENGRHRNVKSWSTNHVSVPYKLTLQHICHHWEGKELWCNKLHESCFTLFGYHQWQWGCSQVNAFFFSKTMRNPAPQTICSTNNKSPWNNSIKYFIVISFQCLPQSDLPDRMLRGSMEIVRQ